LISENGENAYIKLKASNEKEISEIKFAFKDNQGKEYFYETLDVTRINYGNVSDYLINSTQVALENFNDIESVEVIFKYKDEEGKEIETSVLDTRRPIANKTLPIPGRRTGGGETPTPSSQPSCTNDSGCFSSGIFCEENLSYNCTQGNDGCYDRVNLTICSINQECITGTGCKDIVSCTSDSNCNYLNNICSYGVCNLISHNCEVNFNSTAVRCRTSLGQCDIAEFCTGNSATCPENLFNESCPNQTSTNQTSINQTSISECEDSDQNDEYPTGKNIYVKGTVVWISPSNIDLTATDACYSFSSVRENWCCYSQELNSWGDCVSYLSCPDGTGCVDGACITGAECTETCSSFGYVCGNGLVCGKYVNCGSCSSGYTCSLNKCAQIPNTTVTGGAYKECNDTDISNDYPNGLNPYVKGSTQGLEDTQPVVDRCYDYMTLIEFYCSEKGESYLNYINCPSNKCSGGACV